MPDPRGGEERLLHVDARIARDADSRALRVDGIIQDVTDWQRSEAARAQSEAVQTAVIDAALDTVIVINAHGLVVEWNKAAQRTFGWTRAEAVGQELATLIIPGAYRAAHRRAVAAHGTAESKVLGRRLELTALRRDGTEFPVELGTAAHRALQQWPLAAGFSSSSERRSHCGCWGIRPARGIVAPLIKRGGRNGHLAHRASDH